MKFVVEITREHYSAYNKFVANKLKPKIYKNKMIIVLSNLFWILLMMYFFSLFREYQHICKSNFKYVAVNFIILWFVLVVYYIYYKLYYKYFIEYAVRDNGATLGKFEIELTKKGLYSRKPQFEIFYDWSIFNKLDTDDLCHYLIIENSRAFIFPKNQINQEILSELTNGLKK